MQILVNKVLTTNIKNLVIQLGKNNMPLLNKFYEKQKKELELLFLIMTKDKYNVLINEQIIKNIKTFFGKHKSKIVICKPFFSYNDF